MARALAKEGPPLHDGICFHCQQSAEKYMKAVLQEAGVPVPKTHDLEKLLVLAVPFASALGKRKRGLRFLSMFAVDVRYPDADANARQSKAAMNWAERVRTTVRKHFKLRG